MHRFNPPDKAQGEKRPSKTALFAESGVKTPLFHVRRLALCAAGLAAGLLLGAGFSLTYALLAAGVLLLAALGSKLAKRAAWTALLIGMAVGFLRTGLAQPGMVPAGYGEVTGTICETPEPADGDTYRVLLKNAALEGVPIPGRLKLFAAFTGEPAYGQTVTAYACVQGSDGTYRANDRYRGVFAVAFAKGAAQAGGVAAQDLYGLLLRVREALGKRIDELFSDGAAAAKGMLLGDKSDLDEETLTAFRDTGTAHLLAVSGLHVSVLAGAFALLFRRNAWVRFFAVAVFLALYAALTAFSPSVVRAGVMILFALLAFPLRRRLDPVSSLSAAFILILLYNPYALWYAGFQLSFCAVYGLILLAPLLQKPLSRLGSAASGLLAASAAVVAATLPASALFFGEVQLLSLATNIFVLPIMPVFLVPAFLGTALSFVWFSFGNAVCFVARFVLDVILAVTSCGGSLAVLVSPPGAAAYLFYLLAILFASRLCLREAQTRMRYALLAASLAAVFWSVGA
jgi:ComEC/Rec2-related protein